MRPSIAASFLFLSTSALADTWTVDDDGPADFGTIQAAVDFASDGDEILVHPGTYFGDGDQVVDTLGKAIHIRSTEGPLLTVIDGIGNYHCIRIAGSSPNGEMTLEGFTFTGGSGAVYGGGVEVHQTSPDIVNCHFISNSSTYAGGGLRITDGSPRIADCHFEGNTSPFGGGASSAGGSPEFNRCVFINNSCGGDGGSGGGYSSWDSSPIFYQCQFMANSCHENGHAALFSNNNPFYAWPSLEYTLICDNWPSQVSDGYFDLGGNTIQDDCPDQCPETASVFQPNDQNDGWFGWSIDASDEHIAIRNEINIESDGESSEVWSDSIAIYDKASSSLEAILPLPADLCNCAPIPGKSVAAGDGWIAAASFSDRVHLFESTDSGWHSTGSIVDPRLIDCENPGIVDFGFSVSGSGDTLAIGCRENVGDGEDPGIWIYRNSETGWILDQSIPGITTSSGICVDIEGPWLAASSWTGSAIEIYQKLEGQYVPTTTLPAVEGGYVTALELHGNFLAASRRDSLTPGKVELYRFDGDAWSFLTLIEDPQQLVGSGWSIGGFGNGIAIQDNYIAVTTDTSDESNLPFDSCHLFDISSGDEAVLLRSWPNQVVDPEGFPLGSRGIVFGSQSVWVGNPDVANAGDVHVYPLDTVELDCNNNGVCDNVDFARGIAADCDGDGTMDECQIMANPSLDIDLDLELDICEPDCDDDGVPDDHAIGTGIAFDCNENGVPDACDIMTSHSPDNNSDGVPDECAPGYLIRVAANGTEIFSDVQTAIDFALDGSIIEIQPGVYDSFKVRSRSLIIRGSSGPDSTIIDCNGGWGITIMDDGEQERTLSIEGLTIRNGRRQSGGGIFVQSGSPVFDTCVVENCHAITGGGVAIIGGTAYFHSSRIQNNSSIHQGGGVLVSSHNNGATNAVFEETVFKDNSSGLCPIGFLGGGGIYADAGHTQVINSSFIFNHSGVGGGILAAGSSTVSMVEVQMRNNISVSTGGAAFAHQTLGLLLMDSVEICENTSQQVYGDWNLTGNTFISDICPEPCADVVLDGVVNVSDLMAILGAWGTDNSAADVNDDGIVDTNDILTVIAAWGPCP